MGRLVRVVWDEGRSLGELEIAIRILLAPPPEIDWHVLHHRVNCRNGFPKLVSEISVNEIVSYKMPNTRLTLQDSKTTK